MTTPPFEQNVRAYLDELRTYYSTGRPYQEVPIFSSMLAALRANISDGQRILLVGQAGSGKTTTLDQLAYLTSNDGIFIPVYVSLRNYTSSLVDLIRMSLNRFGGESIVEYLLTESTKALFLIDSLDELPRGFQNSVWQEIYEFAHKRVSSAFVVAARERISSALDPRSNPLLTKWVVVLIEPLSQVQMQKALMQVPDGATLWGAISQSDLLIRLFSQPLFLWTLISSWKERRSIDQYFISQIASYATWRGNTRSLVPAKDYMLVDRGYQWLALDTVIRNERWFPLVRVTDVATELAKEPDNSRELSRAMLMGDPLMQDQDRVRFRQQLYQTSYASKAIAQLQEQPEVFAVAVRALSQSIFWKDVIEDIVETSSDVDFSRAIMSWPADVWDRIIGTSPGIVASRLRAHIGPIGQNELITNALIRTRNFLVHRERRRRDILVISVPGFNTRGAWQHTLGMLLGLETDGERFIHRGWDYGNFKCGIINPFARRAKVIEFHEFYNNLIPQFDPSTEVCIVAHSFGSYIVGNALMRFPETRFDRILFLGSALRRKYPWHSLENRCGNVLNIIGGNDLALLATILIPGLGRAGRSGFFSPPPFVKQIIESGSDHSDLFGRIYMQNVWIPFLRDGSLPAPKRQDLEAA